MNKFLPWKILHIDVSESLPNLMAEPNCQGLHLVFWWRGIPLGQQEILAEQLPMPATELTHKVLQAITLAVGDRLGLRGLPDGNSYNFQTLVTLEAPLETMRQHLLNTQAEAKKVSLVICTRDRPKQLVNCLRSLQKLSQPLHEIIVVDNAPTSEATRELVDQFPEVRYVLEPRPGLSVARNTGVRYSGGEIIVFTDDDVEVHPDWIIRLQQSFSNPQVMAVTGLVLPAELATDSQIIFEKEFSGLHRGYCPLTFDAQFFNQTKNIGVPVWQIGAGANMALRREAFNQVGYFDERLGAGASGCSEDSEFWYRILAEGWLCLYEPAAVVYHYHRGNLATLQNQMYQYMKGHVASLLIQFNRYQHWGNIYRILVSLPWYYTKLVLSGIFQGFQNRYSTVFSEIFGCFSGLIFYWKNRSEKAY